MPLRSSWAVASLAVALGCNSLVGLDTLTFSVAGGSGGVANTGGGDAGSGATGGDATGGAGGEDVSCTPGDTTDCFDGPAASRNVGDCVDGTGICNATGDGVEQCNDQVLPAPESCAVDGDEDCNGAANDHCATFTRHIAVSGTESINSVAVGPGDAIAIAGSVRGTVDFGNGDTIDCAETTGVQTLVAVIEADGTYRWAACWGATGTDDEMLALAFDANGDVLATGFFEGTLTELGLTATGTRDMLLVRMAGATGAVTHTLQDGSAGASTQAETLAIDPSSGAYVLAGTFDGDVTPGQVLTADAQDIFVAKLDAQDDVVWARHISAMEDQYEPRLALASNGDVIVTGRYQNGLTIGTTILPNQTGVFITRLASATGNPLWATALDADHGEHIWDVDVDASSIYVSGTFASDITLGGTMIASVGDDDMFVAKLDIGDGSFIWGQTWGSPGTSSDAFTVLSVPGTGVFVGGELLGTIDFGGGELTAVDDQVTRSDALLLALDDDGAHVWSRAFHGEEDDDIFASALDGQGRVVVAGETSSPSLDLGSGPIFGDGLFIARFDP